MRLKSVSCAVAGAVLVLLCTLPALSRPITGSSILRLKKPASREISDQVRAAAVAAFKIDLWEWMKEEADVAVDTTNAIQRFHFFSFADTCLTRAKTASSISGRDMTVAITFSGEEARPLLEAYNTKCYSISLRFYTFMKTALEDSAVTALYSMGIQTIFYTMGRMGTPIGLPDESTPRSFLLEESRKIMQGFFNKFSMRTEEYIIAGKPGTMLALPVKAQALINNAPLAGITVSGVLPGGRKLCSGVTGDDGFIAFSDFKIPYVAKGSMFYFKPDLAAVVTDAPPFDAKDLGLSLPEQSLVFNIIPATFSLTYTVNPVNKIDVPKDFASNAFISKFLRDSCYLAPAAPGGKVDLYFSVASQVSSYNSDETEQTILKLECDAAIADGNRQELVKRQGTLVEKGYENAIAIPYGLFFWEAASKTTKMLKEMIREM